MFPHLVLISTYTKVSYIIWQDYFSTFVPQLPTLTHLSHTYVSVALSIFQHSVVDFLCMQTANSLAQPEGTDIRCRITPRHNNEVQRSTTKAAEEINASDTVVPSFSMVTRDTVNIGGSAISPR